MENTMYKPTEEQGAIIEASTSTTSNLIINALAGCGKTSTLELVERAVKTKPVLYLVFNSKNAKEAEKRMLSTTSVRTFNSIGHRIWAKTTSRNLSLDPKKSATLFRALVSEAPKSARNEMWDSYWPVISGVAMAKALGYVPEGKFTQAKRLCTQGEFHAALDETPDDLTSDLIDAVLAASIKAAFEGGIDYNDQIYMPAIFGGIFPQFPLVLVDEAQDLSPANHALLSRLAKGKNARVIAVGDRYQSIYQFRGAAIGGMETLRHAYSMAPLDLSVSFRCPRAIVEAARWRVPKFQWVKEGGHVETLEELTLDGFPDGAAIICRNNAPLFRLAMQLLANGRSVSVAGSDIGPKLINILKRLGSEDLPRQGVLDTIGRWQAEREDRDSKTAKDLADCMRVFAGHGRTLGEAVSYAEHLLRQDGTIRLLTGHKAKGLEFSIVYHLDPWHIRGEEQDLNLRYVIQTRSMDQYYEIDSACIGLRRNEELVAG